MPYVYGSCPTLTVRHRKGKLKISSAHPRKIFSHLLGVQDHVFQIDYVSTTR
jgi:hypothetical protein